MKQKWIACCLSIVLFGAVGLSACGGGRSGGVMTNHAAPAASSEVAMEKADGMLSDAQYSVYLAESDLYRDPEAKVIRRASLTVQTTEFEESVAALARLTEAHGGYYETARIESGSIHDSRANRSAYYVVRIPKENFTAFRDNMGEVGHLYSIEEGTEDVGERYYDTEARLATLTTKRERLLDLLERAEMMEDIIALESALADVQYEIDIHTATLRKYDSLIDFSTFEIRLNEKVEIEQGPGVTDSFGTRLGGAFSEGMQEVFAGVQNLILWAARNLVGLVVAALAAVAVLWKLRKRWKKKGDRPEE